MQKSRLTKAMEANGVSINEVEKVVHCQLPTVSKRSRAKIVDKAINNYPVFLRGATAEMIMALAVLCNVSSDYLLGLSNTMNPIG